MPTLPKQGCPLALCLAARAFCIPMAMWPSEGSCPVSSRVSLPIKLDCRGGRGTGKQGVGRGRCARRRDAQGSSPAQAWRDPCRYPGD
eukprot:84004-Pyramimonas_sp.AAC.1